MRERACFFFWTGPLKEPAFEPSVHKASIVDKMMDEWIKPGKHQKNPHHRAGRVFLPCPRRGFELTSKSVEFGCGSPLEERRGAAQWSSCILQGEPREQQLMEGGSSLCSMQGSEANSGSQQQHVKFAARCKRGFFRWLCHTQFPKEEAGKLSLICMSFTSLSLAENTLCCSMDSSFLIHCSNYVLQPEYGTYVKADG